MKIFSFISLITIIAMSTSCNNTTTTEKDKPETQEKPFEYRSEQFADIQVLRYQVPGFENLTAKQKELAYYLYEAALSGRDMLWDQNCKYNLTVRKTLENIIQTYKGDKEADNYKKFLVYSKRVFFSNGIHHHYSKNKIQPEFDKAYLAELINNSDASQFPLMNDEKVDAFINRITPIISDASIASKGVSLDSKTDLLKSSAMNYYEGVTQKEAEKFYADMNDPKNKEQVMYGLNSKLVKENGKLVEKVWKVDGMYSAAISKIVGWLEKAATVAENDQQKKTIEALITFYKTGNLKDFDTYSIEWVKDTQSIVDFVNGFIEVYGDPLGNKGSFESYVSIKDMEATKRIEAIANEAAWFEKNSSIDEKHKKPNVKGITAKVITVCVESGDAAPATPIGVNLPNSNWIRETHGSKSVSLGNIVRSYNEAGKGSGLREEFYFDKAMIARADEFGALAADLHTDLHEVIGHASGKLNEGVADPSITLKNYASTLEEARADIVALYFIMDQKMVDIGVMPSLEVGKAEYDNYINNGLMIQLTRIPADENQLEESHMRNRQLIAAWAYEKGMNEKVIEKVMKEGKTYFVINDYLKLRVIFGQLLKELQRIKSEGDYTAGMNLVENYGVKVDPALHKEVLERYAKLKLAPYKGFIQPRLVPVMTDGKITDVKVEYPDNFIEQMLNYGKNYSFLPVNN
jgi:dipeptidyl-peptidase-3